MPQPDFPTVRQAIAAYLTNILKKQSEKAYNKRDIEKLPPVIPVPLAGFGFSRLQTGAECKTADNQRRELERNKRHPIRPVANAECKDRSFKEVVQRQYGGDGTDSRLQKAAVLRRNNNDDQVKETR